MTSQDATVTPLLDVLQHKMKEQPIDFYWIPSADEHFNEYVPLHKKRLQAVSGFTGSAGTVVLSATGKHHIFVDSRYHIQVDQEVNSDLFTIHKMGAPKQLTPDQWIAEQMNKGGFQLGVDPFVVSPRWYQKHLKHFDKQPSKLIPITRNWVDDAWETQPEPLANPIYVLQEHYSGKSTEEKLADIREKMSEASAELLIMSKLDDIAWTTNLRGSDIAYNPVFESYLLVTADKALCFCHPEAKRPELPEDLITFLPYSDYVTHLKKLIQSVSSVWLDSGSNSMGTRLILSEQKKLILIDKPNPVILMKAQKNETELDHIQEAHRQAGAAKIRSFVALQKRLAKEETVSEADYEQMLYQEYAKAPNFKDLSFNTIAGFAENAAIVHYGTPDPEKRLEGSHLFLIDSGVQILGGTTDDTRTLIIGEPDQKHRQLYTLVLQAHIRLARQQFPEGTRGSALDAITRSNLWNAGIDFGHGTGHGVGAFLNVHEGPHSISPLSHQTPLMPGMIVSNEPGYYETGWGGIRLENLYAVIPSPRQTADPRQWLALHPLTLIPFEPRLIEIALLAPEEISWLNAYHQLVFDQISPMLDAITKAWLQTQTVPLPVSKA